MPNDTPQTLPANFFDKKGDTTPPQTLPSEFFAKAETPKEEGVKTKPLDLGQATSISAQPSFWQRIKSAAVSDGPVGIGQELGRSMRTPFEQSTIPVPGTGKTIGDATRAQGDWANLAMTTIGLTGGAGIGGPEAFEAVGEATVGKLASKASPIQKVNKLLGVSAKEIVPGKLPQSLDEFAVNPARGVLKSIEEGRLAKMDALERNEAIMKAKDAAGKQLGKVLDQAGQQGKTVDAYKVIDKTFSKLDSTEISKAEKLLQDIFQKQKIDIGTLDKLTPSQANLLKQALWEDGGEVAEQIRRGVAEGIKTAVPEAKDALRDYGDLAGAAKAAQRGAAKFAKEAPESQLRKLIMKKLVPKSAEGAAITGGGILAYELYKALFGGKGSTPVP